MKDSCVIAWDQVHGQSREDEHLKCLSLVSLHSYGDRVVSTASWSGLETRFGGLEAVLAGPGIV